MHVSRTRRYLLSTLTALVWLTPSVWAQDESEWTTTEERWYVMEMFGSQSGWMSSTVQTRGGEVRTVTNTSMKLNRGSITLEIAMGNTFTETAEGKPVSIHAKQDMSLQVMETLWEFEGDTIKVTTKQGGVERTSEQPMPEGEWLTPRAIERYAQQQRSAGADTITYRTMDPQAGVRLVTVTATRTGTAKFTRDGEEIDVTVWSIKNDLMPVEMVEHSDASGKMVYQETNMQQLGKMVLRLATKEQAQGGAAVAAVPEVLVQTFVTPDKPIDHPHKSVRAKLKLTVKDGQIGELPSAGAQRVEIAPDRQSAILTIDINNNLPATAAERNNKEYLAASAMIDSEDELIKKLAKDAVARIDSSDEMEKAEAIRKAARSHISKKGMATAFASASETAKMRTGDCSEHGVLLAAMLRADGIPARVAVGLIYADAFAGHEGIFGWHMWTQALVDGRWVDFDATTRERYNATHILTSTSSLKDGAMAADFTAVIQLIGNLNIEVLSVDYE